MPAGGAGQNVVWSFPTDGFIGAQTPGSWSRPRTCPNSCATINAISYRSWPLWTPTCALTIEPPTRCRRAPPACLYPRLPTRTFACARSVSTDARCAPLVFHAYAAVSTGHEYAGVPTKYGIAGKRHFPPSKRYASARTAPSSPTAATTRSTKRLIGHEMSACETRALKVLATRRYPGRSFDELSDVEIGSLDSLRPDVEAVIVANEPVPLDLLPSLRLVANFGVGYDRIDVAAAAERGIAVTNTR